VSDETTGVKASGVKKLLGLLDGVPVLGALAREGVSTSEFGLVGALAWLIYEMQIPEGQVWAKAVGLGLLGAGYAVSRAMKKA
jgi:hypothetical protein